jgi:hypothetical protein
VHELAAAARGASGARSGRDACQKFVEGCFEKTRGAR